MSSVATGRILEAPEYFRHGWMRITNYVAEALRNHIDTHIKSSNDRLGNFDQSRESVHAADNRVCRRNRLQDVPG